MHAMDDLDSFAAWVRALPRQCSALGTWFAPEQPIWVARAPGRLDVMGGIADYSGSLVLEMPIAEAACCAVQLNGTGRFEAATVDADGAARTVEAPLAWLDADAAQVRDHFAGLSERDGRWGAYLFGPLYVLVREAGAARPEGVRMLLASNVPEGKGVSSSAAVEVAASRALAAALGQTLDGRAHALLCQSAENRIAGAPCGVMDQMAAALGRAHELLALRCQPAEVLGHRTLPRGWRIWGVDSGVRHAVSGSDYASVRVGAFAGYRIIAQAAGLKIDRVAPGRVRIGDPCWHGYLANISPSRFEATYRKHLPEHLTGRELLERYGGTTDDVTRIDPDHRYAIAQPIAHPIYENHRVRLFAALLQTMAEMDSALDEEAGQLLGELMHQSHVSYSECGLGSDATDALVERVRAAGPTAGLYGAKITGGGSGGTVAILGRADAEPLVRRIADDHARDMGCPITVFAGSSPGAMAVEPRSLLQRPSNASKG